MTVDFSDRVVLVTGGTMGIGLQTALAFSHFGAQCVLTCHWGTADEDDVRSRFSTAGGHSPLILHADAGQESDTIPLMHRIQEHYPRIDVLISNVTVGLMTPDLDSYRLRSLLKTIESSSWPLVDYTMAIHKTFGAYPSHVVAMSSDGPDSYTEGYDFVASAKAVLETLVRYLNHRLREQGVRVNAVRTRGVETASSKAAFGEEFEAFRNRLVPDRYRIDAQDVASAVVALCSGLFDGMGGQVLTVDRGTGFFDNLMRMYEERDELGL